MLGIFKKTKYIYINYIANHIFDYFVIYAILVGKYNFSYQEISNLFILQFGATAISIMVSGILFDKFQQKNSILTSIFLNSCSGVLLLSTLYYEKFLYIYILISAISSAFELGKAEASIYQQTSKTHMTKYYPLLMSFYFIIDDLISTISPLLTSLFAKNNIGITIMITISLLFKIISFFLIKKSKNIVSTNTSSQVNIKTIWKHIQNTAGLMNKVVIFSIYVSIMYTYKEFLLIIGKITNSAQDIAIYKSKYHLFMLLGSIASILLASAINKYKHIFIYIVPISLTACIFTSSALLKYDFVIYCLYAISASFATFQISTEKEIDKKNTSIIGTTNSIIWLGVILFSLAISIMIKFLLQIFTPSTSITLIYLTYFVLIVVVYAVYLLKNNSPKKATK